jgi:hypothetical protein
MSTYDKTGAGALVGLPPFDSGDRSYVLSNTVDLTGSAMVSAAIYQSLAVPPDVLVESVHLRIDTAAVGSALDMTVGHGGVPAGWDASVDGKATAGTYTHSVVGTDTNSVAANNGFFYANAGTVAVPVGDSIDVVMATATSITAGPKYTIFAVCKNLH